MKMNGDDYMTVSNDGDAYDGCIVFDDYDDGHEQVPLVGTLC